MIASGTRRNASPNPAASFTPHPARSPSECIERPKLSCAPQIKAHDDDGVDGEGGGERDVPGRALLRVDDLADEQAAVADDLWPDEIAQRQRAGEDRTRAASRQRQGKAPVAE